MSYSIGNLPEGIKVSPTCEEEFYFNLSDKELALAQQNANKIIDDLMGESIKGDDIRIAIMLKYEPKVFQNPKQTWSIYSTKSLLKYLNEDFKFHHVFY